MENLVVWGHFGEIYVKVSNLETVREIYLHREGCLPTKKREIIEQALSLLTPAILMEEVPQLTSSQAR